MDRSSGGAGRLVLSLGLAAIAATSPASAAAGEVFVDRAVETGLVFTYFNGMSGAYYFPEIVGGGAALFDYDNDGDLDVYLVQGSMLGPGKKLADATYPPPAGEQLIDRLFRNDLRLAADGSHELRFTDVTAESGLAATAYGMGVSAGDFDNDGWIDLYVTNWGSNQMLRNNGDGTFSDLTEKSGTDDNRWSVPASVFDFDRDGQLDLYVGNYVHFSYAEHKPCARASGAPDYCSPLAYTPVSDRLFRNRGDGVFEDVSVRSGITSEFGAALGSVATDADGDGWLDLYVGNDGTPNQLWMNQRDGTFANGALLAGCSVNREGVAQASMGVAAGDFDNDGDEDLFMTHLIGETNTFYANDGTGLYDDTSQESGLGVPSLGYTAFGTWGIDYDNDGWLDLLVANGAVTAIEALDRTGNPYPLHQPNLLFHNRGRGSFEDASATAGAVFAIPEVSRGVAFGDVDNDGDTDAVLVNSAGPTRLLINQVGQEASWIGLRLVGGKPPRDMLGARVGILPKDGAPLWRQVRTDGGYTSAHDPRVLAGLGTATAVDRVQVFWPDGTKEQWSGLPVREYRVLTQGSGEPLP